MQERHCAVSLLLLMTIAACGPHATESDEPGNAIRPDGSSPPANVTDAAAVTEAGNARDASDAAAPAPPDPNGCAFFYNDAPTIAAIQSPTQAPPALGGDVVPGRYHRTAFRVYTGPGGASGPLGAASRETVLVHENTFSRANDSEPASSYSFATSGAYFTRTRNCPSAATADQMSVTATPTSFVLFEPLGDGTTSAITYTLQ